jgi:glycosyltransferase involved in cell wall biosynthesis
MVANESHVIIRMLESCYRHIDHWVIQDNGSTDGTQDLIQNFFKEKNIPGILYSTPWKFPGVNRDEALQTCIGHDHGCDWILRTDADESLIVEDGFDWSILDDKSVQSFQIFAHHNNFRYFRCWLWNATLPWRFKHDKRHEVIYLDKDGIGEKFQRVNLPTSFRHIVHANGRTSLDSSKFFNDALEIERDMLVGKTMTTDLYHLFYLARSYRDAATNASSSFPFGEDQRLECCRRSIFYFKKYVELTYDPKKVNYFDENLYVCMVFIGDLYERIKDDKNAIHYLTNAEKFCGRRNEHLLRQAELHKSRGNHLGLFDCTSRLLKENKPNPCPELSFFVNNNAYLDTSNYINELHEFACRMNGIK